MLFLDDSGSLLLSRATAFDMLRSRHSSVTYSVDE